MVWLDIVYSLLISLAFPLGSLLYVLAKDEIELIIQRELPRKLFFIYAASLGLILGLSINFSKEAVGLIIFLAAMLASAIFSVSANKKELIKNSLIAIASFMSLFILVFILRI